MPASTAYRSRRSHRSQDTRERIMRAVRELLAEGTFHEAPVEKVAERAGISRATLYQHFRSRVDLVDAICDTFAVNPALQELREAVELPDLDAALVETIALSIRFWASEDLVLAQLYDVAAIDPAARDLVDRQRADRRGELERLARRLGDGGRLRPGIDEQRANQALMVLTAYDTFRELSLAGMSESEAAQALQESARTLLIG